MIVKTCQLAANEKWRRREMRYARDLSGLRNIFFSVRPREVQTTF